MARARVRICLFTTASLCALLFWLSRHPEPVVWPSMRSAVDDVQYFVPGIDFPEEEAPLAQTEQPTRR